MKFLAILGVLVAGVTALRTTNEEHEVFANHELFFCCKRKGGEDCGLVYQSCCQPGKCTQSKLKVWYCPD